MEFRAFRPRFGGQETIGLTRKSSVTDLQWRSREMLYRYLEALSSLMVGSAVVLLLQSQSNPWLLGVQHEPYCSWAVGSGRLKVWLAEPGVFSRTDVWPNSWYRGLDGQPIRWDVTLSRGSTGGVIVIALPLWTFALLGGISGIGLLFLGHKQQHVQDSSGEKLMPGN